MRGPIDYIIVGFKGNNFNGSILKAIADAIDKGAIKLVALSVVAKSKKGEVNAVDIAEIGDEYTGEFIEKYKPSHDEFNQDDFDEVAELLENDTAAGLLAVEQVWAVPLKKAILDANGSLIAEGRIHPDAAAELEK
jgi:hypothetical protein